VKKATAADFKAGGLSASLAKVGPEKKGQGNNDRPAKKVSDPSTSLDQVGPF